MSYRRAAFAALIALVAIQPLPALAVDVYKPPVRYLNGPPPQPKPKDGADAQSWLLVRGLFKIGVGVAGLWYAIRSRSGRDE